MSSLEDKILKELAMTGFPTEIVSAGIMQGREWFVVHNPSYVDDTEPRSREFDIQGYREKAKQIGEKRYEIGIYLIAECKKSEKPWVFFTTPEKHQDWRSGSVIKWYQHKKQVFTDWSHSESLISDECLRDHHHYFREARLARTFHHPFRSEKEHSQMIYSASALPSGELAKNVLPACDF
jgi:hypothetical protein